MIPNSFCTLSNYNSHHELFGLLLSLSIFHPHAKIYIGCDQKTKDSINSYSPKLRLNIQWEIILEKYRNTNRHEMEKKKLFHEFLMKKMDILLTAIENDDDSLFLDADMILLDQINDIDKTKDLGVSPHYFPINSPIGKKYGFYNAGMIWSNNKNAIIDWKILSQDSYFYEQSSIEDLIIDYEHFEFSDNYNFGEFRLSHNKQSYGNSLNIINEEIYVHEKKLKSIHTHIDRHYKLNFIIYFLLLQCKNYKILSIINRIKDKKWIINIPYVLKDPVKNGKSFKITTIDSAIPGREFLCSLINTNTDIQIHKTNLDNVYLQNHILFYDNDTLGWEHNINYDKISLLLLANGNKNVEEEYFKKKNKYTQFTFFWPKNSQILESFLLENKSLTYEERKTESIFIGNMQCKEQKKYRYNNDNWENIITKFHLTGNHKHLFSPEIYFKLLSESKFGLCLRGYGSKCHREIELMALGTVPILTPEVSIDYNDPLIENYHYIKINKAEDLKNKLQNINKEKWMEMSENCKKWYFKNCHSKNCWNTLLNQILFN
jgi:hypothetical protein